MLNKKTVSILLSIVIVVAAASAALAALNLYYQMPMDATVQETVSFSFYVDNATWTNNTAVTWGTVTPGESYLKSFDVHNTGNVPVQIIMYLSGLPSGWDLTYSRNGSSVMADNWMNGTITLLVSGSAAEASYYWTTTIYAS